MSLPFLVDLATISVSTSEVAMDGSYDGCILSAFHVETFATLFAHCFACCAWVLATHIHDGLVAIEATRPFTVAIGRGVSWTLSRISH